MQSRFNLAEHENFKNYIYFIIIYSNQFFLHREKLLQTL